MKTTIDKEFFEKWKDEDVVMWCKKEEYAKEFCRLMNERGLTWITGKNYLKNTEWNNYTRGTAYYFNIGTFSDVENFEEEGYTILDFEDYIVHEQETAGMKMYEYEIGEITEEGDKTSVTGMMREVKNDLEQRNLPAHYNIAGINTMDFILGVCEHNDTDQRETFYLANTLKYLIRYKNKNGLEDLKKAKDYLNRLIEYTKIENLPFYNVDGQGD